MDVKDYPVELVQWTDACGPDSVVTLTLPDIDELEPLDMAEVGFLVKETGAYIVLAPQISSEDGFRRPICIPKVCITKRTQLFGRKK
jgi:hypothetical protein